MERHKPLGVSCEAFQHCGQLNPAYADMNYLEEHQLNCVTEPQRAWPIGGFRAFSTLDNQNLTLSVH